MSERLLSIGESSVRRALSEGAEEAEAYLISGRTIVVEVEKGEIKTAKTEVVEGIGIRSIVGHKVGFAYSVSLGRASESAVSSVKNAKASKPDPDIKGLPSPSKPSHVPGLFDKKVAELDVSDVVEYLKVMVEAASSKRGVVSVSGAMSASHYTVAVVNSNGISVAEDRTSCSLYSFVAGRDGDKSSSGYEQNSGRFLREIDPEWVGSQAGELASMLLDAVRAETGQYALIIDPLTANAFLGFLVSSAANAENVIYGRSFLTGKLGETIARGEITLIDDGTLPEGEGSAGFDGEGVPTQRTPIISEGRLVNYIHNFYTAGKMGVETTGNASRSYNSPPSVGSHNIVLEADRLRLSRDDLLEVKRGVLLKLTMDRPNLANGEFSGMVYMGFLVENGEIKAGIKEASFGLHLLDFLKGIDAVGDDVRRVGTVVTPSIRVRSVRIAGPS